MQKTHFQHLFENVLQQARAATEVRLGCALSENTLIKLASFGRDREWMSVEACLDMIYIGFNDFYRFIDVAVMATSNTYTGYFVRVSGHTPGSWEQTWEPHKMGPFRILTVEVLKPLDPDKPA